MKVYLSYISQKLERHHTVLFALTFFAILIDTLVLGSTATPVAPFFIFLFVLFVISSHKMPKRIAVTSLLCVTLMVILMLDKRRTAADKAAAWAVYGLLGTVLCQSKNQKIPSHESA